jgi:hypothetical protein
MDEATARAKRDAAQSAAVIARDATVRPHRERFNEQYKLLRQSFDLIVKAADRVLWDAWADAERQWEADLAAIREQRKATP